MTVWRLFSDDCCHISPYYDSLNVPLNVGQQCIELFHLVIQVKAACSRNFWSKIIYLLRDFSKFMVEINVG